MRISLTNPLWLAALLVSGAAAQRQTSSAAATTGQTTSAAQSTSQANTSSPKATNTNTGKTDSASDSTSLPAITGTSTGPVATITAPTISISGGGIAAPSLTSALPSIAGAYRIVPPSVPPKANAPYLRHSQIPEGTFFIATGAALGLLGLSVIIWRCAVAYALHRSVRRAQREQNLQDTKALIGPPGGGFYGQYAFAPSEHSIEQLVRGGRKENPAAQSRTSLYFSPTGAGMANMSQNTLSNSGFLPSGYYPANAQSASHLSYPAQNPGLYSDNPAGYVNSPQNRASFAGQGSPALPPSRDGLRRSLQPQPQSQGSNTGPAPSAFLEELLDNQGGRGGAPASGFRG